MQHIDLLENETGHRLDGMRIQFSPHHEQASPGSVLVLEQDFLTLVWAGE